MSLEMVSRLRRYQGQCRALRPLGHEGYRLRSYKKDLPLHSGYMVAVEIMTLLLESPRTPLGHRALAGLSLVLSHFVFAPRLHLWHLPSGQVSVRPPENGGSAAGRSTARKWRIRRCAFARPTMEDPQVHGRPPENGKSAGARLSAREWRIHRCVFARREMEDPQVRVRPPENAGSAGARLPARRWRIRRCMIARRKMEDPQVQFRPPENGGSAGACSPARKWSIRRCTFARPKMEDLQVRV